MVKRFHGFYRRSPISSRMADRRIGICLFLAASFMFGSVLCLVFSLDFDLSNADVSFAEYTAHNFSVTDYFRTFLGSLCFPALLFLASTSLLGVFAAPVCVAVLGYRLTHSSASVFFLYPDSGWPVAFISVGLPALLCLPCIIYLGADAFCASVSLLRNEPRISRFSGPALFIKHFFLFLPLFLTCAAVENVFMPYLLGLMID